MRLIPTFLFLVLSPLAVYSQEVPDLSQAHNYWDRPNQLLLITHVALEGADFAITHHNLSRGGRELNPMGKALCESGTGGQVVFFAGRSAGVVAISYLFHRTGHHRLERSFIALASADSAFGVSYSFTHR